MTKKDTKRQAISDLEQTGPAIFGMIWGAAPAALLMQWFVEQAMAHDLVPTWSFWWVSVILIWGATGAAATWIVLKLTRDLRQKTQDLEEELEKQKSKSSNQDNLIPDRFVWILNTYFDKGLISGGDNRIKVQQAARTRDFEDMVHALRILKQAPLAQENAWMGAALNYLLEQNGTLKARVENL